MEVVKTDFIWSTAIGQKRLGHRTVLNSQYGLGKWEFVTGEQEGGGGSEETSGVTRMQAKLISQGLRTGENKEFDQILRGRRYEVRGSR